MASHFFPLTRQHKLIIEIVECTEAPKKGILATSLLACKAERGDYNCTRLKARNTQANPLIFPALHAFLPASIFLPRSIISAHLSMPSQSHSSIHLCNQSARLCAILEHLFQKCTHSTSIKARTHTKHPLLLVHLMSPQSLPSACVCVCRLCMHLPTRRFVHASVKGSTHAGMMGHDPDASPATLSNSSADHSSSNETSYAGLGQRYC